MDLNFKKLPAQFKNNRIFLCPITEEGHCLEFYTDTGGGGMFIDPEIVRELNLPILYRTSKSGEGERYVSFPKYKDEASIRTGDENNELIITSEIPWGTRLFRE